MDDDVRRQIFYSRYKDGVKHVENLDSDNAENVDAAKAYFANLSNLLPHSPLASFFNYLANPPTETELLAIKLNRKCHIAYKIAQEFLYRDYLWSSHVSSLGNHVGWVIGQIRFILSNNPTSEDLLYILERSRMLIEWYDKNLLKDVSPDENQWICVIFTSGICAVSAND